MSPQRPQARYGMRADGSNVDGNEPGGVNGQMGAMGAPPTTPTPGNLQQRSGPISGGGMAQANMQQAQQTGANIGKAVNRYRQPKPTPGTLNPSNPSFSGGSGDSTATLGFPQAPGADPVGPIYGGPVSGGLKPIGPAVGTPPDGSDPSNPAPPNSPLADQNADMQGGASPQPGSQPPPSPYGNQAAAQSGAMPQSAPPMSIGGQGISGGIQGSAQEAAQAQGGAASGQVGAPGSFSGDDGDAPKAAGLGAAMDAMATGGMVTKPTIAMLGEHGPEAVVPLNNPNAKITPGMLPMQKQRYRPMTGPQSVHGPMRPLAPSPVNAQEHPSGWKKYDTSHPRT